MKPLEPILKMPQRPQELRCCKELLVSKVPCSSAWVGGTRERGYNSGSLVRIRFGPKHRAICTFFGRPETS